MPDLTQKWHAGNYGSQTFCALGVSADAVLLEPSKEGQGKPKWPSEQEEGPQAPRQSPMRATPSSPNAPESDTLLPLASGTVSH